MPRQPRESFVCTAPIFPAHGPLYRAVYILEMVGLIVLTLGFATITPRGKCRLQRLKFQIENCTYGNSLAVPLSV